MSRQDQSPAAIRPRTVRMRWFLPVLAWLLTSGTVPAVADPAATEALDARQAFARLESLAGTWRGLPKGEGGAESEAAQADEVVHEIILSAAGTVVMETMQPGTDHEMINMYHLDGEDLVLTHYCAGGNQPVMRLDRGASSASKLVFAFAGGTNFDPAVDQHIHQAEIRWVDEARIESAWEGHVDGSSAGIMTFSLARAE